ncbi:hypothetical protein C9374_010054 [Naegleria lovaniensis]|uniref:Uncharacterized protein n=1 Tax=Naegleria lovaniensis TaxID=51637 RepID=A0AA88KDW2_NAELO|nr:uncharacterized protein C9374_010054 [Naegleria lovaniensis]KAG2375050.1 hypothetical protein C9374_010054 [Naegleria lovaniensis]
MLSTQSLPTTPSTSIAVESTNHTTSKAPKGSLQSFYLLLGALDYINDAQEYPRLSTGRISNFSNALMQGDDDNDDEETLEEDHNHDADDHTQRSRRRTRRTSRRTFEDEDFEMDNDDEEEEQELEIDEEDSEWSEEEQAISSGSAGKSSSSRRGQANAAASMSSSTTVTNHHANKIQHVNSEGLQICACCKRDSTVVSFLKNYSIHQGNIHNYRNCFPEYDVIPGISCMTCYHKQWRYTKGLYDPNKARNGSVNKREGIQRSNQKKNVTSQNSDAQSTHSSSSSNQSSKRKRSSSATSNSQASTHKRKKGIEDAHQGEHQVEEMNRDDVSSSNSSSSKKPRKLAKRKKEAVMILEPFTPGNNYSTLNVIMGMNKNVVENVDVARTLNNGPQEYGLPSTSTSGMMVMPPVVTAYQF